MRNNGLPEITVGFGGLSQRVNAAVGITGYLNAERFAHWRV